MEINKFFENTDIELQNNDIQASRKQVQELYEADKATLRRQINKLKEDGLLRGVKSDPKSGKSIEVYNLDEAISIGFRLRTPIAIRFQRWARNVLKHELKKEKEKTRQAQIMESIAWNHLDAKDNHR